MGTGLKVGDNVFVCYLNDDGTQRTAYFDIADINDNSITFKSNQGLLFFPISRIIKIKLNSGEN